MSPLAWFATAARRHCPATGQRAHHPAARSRAATVALVPLAAVALLAGCGGLPKLGAGTHNPPATRYTVAGPVTSVVINGGSGSVNVTGSSRSTVAVSEQASYSGKAPSATHVLRGTTLTLSYTCPRELVCDVSYTVQVPAGVTLSAGTGAGAITLTSLAGTVTAHAGAGLITAVSMRSAVASLKSVAGGVVATFSAVPRSLTATTHVGPVTLTVPGTVAYRLSTHTLVGTTTITVRRDSGSAYAITASSDLGSISVNPS